MDKTTRAAAITAGLIILCFFIWAALPKDDFTKKMKARLLSERNKADIIFKDAQLAEIYDGIKYWELVSKSSTINNATSRADMANVNGLFFDNGLPTIKFIAPSAIWRIKNNEIVLNDPVGYDIKSEKAIMESLFRTQAVTNSSFFHLPDPSAKSLEGYWFLAKNLNWKLSTKKLLCTGSISLTKGNFTVNSEKLEADVGLEKVVLTGNPSAEIRTGNEYIITNANKFTVDSSMDAIVAEGRVRFLNGRSEIVAGRAVFDQKQDVINMSGDVTVIDPPIIASSRTASYDIKNKSIVLAGNARAKRDGNELNGETITILLGLNRLIVEGGTKARIKGVELK